MTSEAQRVAIAEALGWVWYLIPPLPLDSRRLRCLFLPAIHEYEGQDPRWLVRADGSERICNIDYMAREGHIPDFPNDLNACADFEKTLDVNITSGDSPRFAYSRFVYEIVTRDDPFAQPFRATAAQRCEAFLKVKLLWKD